MSLKSELQTIDGVGDKTADKILDVLDDHSKESENSQTQVLLEEALEYYRQGDENICAEYVEKALQRL